MEKFGVGQAVRRREDMRFLRGRGCYADDRKVPEAAWAAFVRSPHACADVASVDAEAARRAPGVVAVLDGRDYMPEGHQPFPAMTDIQGMSEEGVRVPPRTALSDKRVRHVGEVVAMAIAETREQALAAAERIVVSYDERPHAVDVASSLDPEASRVWERYESNRCFLFESGDAHAADAAIAASAHSTSLSLVNNRLVPCSLEPRSATATWSDSVCELRLSGQAVHAQRAHLTTILGIPLESLRVVADDVGGGFGAKNFTYPENVLLLWASRRLGGRPVRWTAERSENFLAEIHARDHVTTASLALDREGRFRALKVETLANMGAYVSAYAPVIPTSASVVAMGGVYVIPDAYMKVEGVFTNTVPVDAYRGAGRPEAAYIIERLVDLAADEIGVDRFDLRRRNMIRTFPHRTAFGVEIDCGDFEGTFASALRLSDAEGFSARRREAEARGAILGFGVAPYLETTLGGPQELAELEFVDGGLRLRIGTQSTGQGHDTAWTQILVERLGVPPESVSVESADTSALSFGGGHGGSRSLSVGGGALVKAIETLTTRSLAAAAEMWDDDDVRFEDGMIIQAKGNRRMSLLELAEALGGSAPSASERYVRETLNFPNGCHVAEVEIDLETGFPRLTRYAVVDDFGRIVNPLIAAGQTVGGAAQGLGQALLENAAYDEQGQLLSGSFMDYALPRADDLCDMDVEFNENAPTATNPLGVKGAGEAGATGAPPAAVNAILDALKPYGVRHIDMPVTSEKIWKAVRKATRT